MNRTPVILIISGILLFFIVAGIVMFRFVSQVFGHFGGSPHTFGEYNISGNRHYSQGEYGLAVTDYSSMIELEPNRPEGYLLRAMAYSRMNNYKKSISDNTKALQLVSLPQEKESLYFNRGLDYNAQSQWDKAISDFTEVIRYKPEDYDAYRERAHAYDSRGDHAKAVDDMRRGTELQPSKSSAWGELGWYQYEAGQVRESIANSQKALDMDPTATYARSNMALGYATQGNWSEAESEYRQVISQSNPQLIQATYKDIQDALKKHPRSSALKKARDLLSQARAGGAQ